MSKSGIHPDRSVQVTVPIRREGDRWAFLYGGEVPVKDGAVGELTLDTDDLVDPQFVQRLTQEMTFPILDEGAELLVALSDRSQPTHKRLGHWPDRYPIALPPGTTRLERIWLGPSKSKESSSSKQVLLEGVACDSSHRGGLWLKVKGLDRCELMGSTVRMPDDFEPGHAVSLNHAFTRLSERYEAHRLSHTGNVYERIFYQDRDQAWYPLDDLRRGVLASAERALITALWRQVETTLGWRPPPPAALPRKRGKARRD